MHREVERITYLSRAFPTVKDLGKFKRIVVLKCGHSVELERDAQVPMKGDLMHCKKCAEMED